VTGYFRPGTGGATYTPLAPARLVDTRVKNGLSSKLVANKPATFTVRGRGGVPTEAIAVTGNLTVTNSTYSCALYLGPAPIAKPASSTVNFVAGQIRANSLTVSLSPTGTLSATFISGKTGATTQMVFDVTGYYTAGTAGASYVPLTPVTLLDSGSANGYPTKFAASVPGTFTVAGRGNVDASATGVTGILAVYNQTANYAAYIGPDPIIAPSTSNLNFNKGDNCSNGFTVSLSATGSLSATYMGGAGQTTDMIAVITGYFVATP
jgi:hypothetical protein